MDTPQEQSRKCFCARCFLPIDPNDKVDVEGQNFHRLCSMCCICRTVPTSLKMFYGHVFCTDCFKMHMASRFRGETPRMHTNSWWMQWSPGCKSQEKHASNENSDESTPKTDETPKRCVCARCLQMVNDANKVEIGGQSFHSQCAKCYFCHAVPTNSVKIYYGQAFCEQCFYMHVMNRSRDNPSEFFKTCFEQWQTNTQFAETMREFMAGSKDAAPFVFMMNGEEAPFCRCGTNQEHVHPNEPGKSATPAPSTADDSIGTCDLSFENRTVASEALEYNESASRDANAVAAEKIEKLTRYLHERLNIREKEENWKIYEAESLHGWVSLQGSTVSVECPSCLWQCGAIYISSDYLQQKVCAGDYCSEFNKV